MGIDPVTLGLIAAGAVASIGGTALSASAQAKTANAIQQQNLQTQQAQQQAFGMRLGAANAQTDAQRAAAEQTLADRNAAFSRMRDQQLQAQQSRQDVLAAENVQAEKLRAAGDEQAQQLLQQTNADKLAAAQDEARKQQATLLAASTPGLTTPGPEPSAPNEPESKRALARRLAEASSNVRDYGAKVADLQSYDEPVRSVGLAIAGNQAGIMPAEAADALLRSGSTTRLLPTQVAFRNAGDLGSAMDQLLVSKGQSAQDAASLLYGNKIAGANLLQGDLTQEAANKAAQAKADAQFQQQIGGIISGIGQLGLYGAGYNEGGGFSRVAAPVTGVVGGGAPLR